MKNCLSKSVASLPAIDAQGWLDRAERRPSPNFDARPGGMPIELIVLHNISLPPGCFGGDEIADFFCNRLDYDAHPFFQQIRGVEVSAHFLIRRDGHILQFVSCEARAWHAGASQFDGRSHCNDFSVGIELEGTDVLPFSELQYIILVQLIHVLMRRYPIRALAGHADIAPSRKTDPGPAFDWARLANTLLLPATFFPYGLASR